MNRVEEPVSDDDWDSVVAWDDDEIMSMAQTLLGEPMLDGTASEVSSQLNGQSNGAEADDEADGTNSDTSVIGRLKEVWL